LTPENAVLERAPAPPRASKEAWLPARALTNVLVVALLAGAAVTAVVLFRLDGYSYYATPLTVRGYAKPHRLLRSSGLVGHGLGIVGTGFVFLTLLYVIRKKIKRLSRVGTMKGWLEFHIFCGIFGPILVTLHTTLKFNGIVSVAYWSMVLVVLSGFVGRYLFVRIPKTIRGKELDRSELEERAAELKEQLAETALPAPILAGVEILERETLALVSGHRSFWRRWQLRWRVRHQRSRVRRQIRASGLDPALLHEALEVITERAQLLMRIAHLNRRKELFALWHVFHKPLVYLMLLILVVHVGVALYFGYTPGWFAAAHR
jgi:hypothetical protein